MPSIFSYLAIALTLLVALSLLVTIALTGVPSLPSSRSETSDVVALLKQAALPERAVIVDLGSGWGTLVVALARAFPEASVRGVEMSPFPYLISRLRTGRLRNVSLRWGNFLHGGLGDADAVTCYLMPGLMQPVGDLLDGSARPGTRVVTNTFLFRGRVASAVRRGTLRGTVALYVWPARHGILDEML